MRVETPPVAVVRLILPVCLSWAETEVRFCLFLWKQGIYREISVSERFRSFLARQMFMFQRGSAANSLKARTGNWQQRIREAARVKQGMGASKTGKLRSGEIERFLFDPVHRHARLYECCRGQFRRMEAVHDCFLDFRRQQRQWQAGADKAFGRFLGFRDGGNRLAGFDASEPCVGTRQSADERRVWLGAADTQDELLLAAPFCQMKYAGKRFSTKSRPE